MSKLKQEKENCPPTNSTFGFLPTHKQTQKKPKELFFANAKRTLLNYLNVRISMKNFDRNLQILATISTIINLIFSFTIEVKPEDLTIISFDSFSLNLATRVIILIILELVLASTFGLVIKHFTKKNFDKNDFFPLYIIGIITVSLISAWVSIFNIRFFVYTGELSTPWNYAIFFFFILATFINAMFFIIWHFNNLTKNDAYSKYKDDHKEILPIILQAFAFIIIFLTVIIDNYYIKP